MAGKSSSGNDLAILRDLAKQYAEIGSREVQASRRNLWRDHNSLKRVGVPIYVRAYAAGEIPELKCRCSDPFYRGHESFLRREIFRDNFGDDTIVEPWITQKAVYDIEYQKRWGPEIKLIPSPEARGSWLYDPPIKRLEDLDNLVAPRHVVNEAETARRTQRLHDAVGDILQVNVSRAPFLWVWQMDLSTDLAYLRGLEQVMWDMMDNPGWLHRLLAFMRDAVLAAHEKAEANGDLHTCDHYNQAMPYARELPDPRADGESVPRSKLWCFMAAQEFTGVSAAMHEEFMLRYQMEIMKPFGLAAYGCCEELQDKIGMLRNIPNLRRIALAPRADVKKAAEQIGSDYVCSYRPNPADMVSAGFDPNRMRCIVGRAMEVFKANDCIVDITLKDVETVEHEPGRIREWVKIVREITEDYS